jgi:hypothetical protein
MFVQKHCAVHKEKQRDYRSLPEKINLLRNSSRDNQNFGAASCFFMSRNEAKLANMGLVTQGPAPSFPSPASRRSL